MTLVARVLAQVVDLFVAVMAFLVAFGYALPFLGKYISNSVVLAVVALVLIIALTAGLQYPFMTNDQTIGKAFFGLRIVSTEPGRPVTVPIIIQREIFCKLASCYIICIPLFLNRDGGHDEATRTTVEKAPVKRRVRRISKKAR